MPEPPVCSMVSVYSTTLPHRSETVRLVVLRFSVSSAVRPAPGAGVAHDPSYDAGLPAATGGVKAAVSLILQARSAAKLSSSSEESGTSTYAGSPT